MNPVQHKQTEGLVTQVTRSFDIAVAHYQALDEGVKQVGSVPGVTQAEVNSDRTKLEVTYDVREATAEDIQSALETAEMAAPSSVWRRIRVAWQSNLDINCRDNAAHRPACCSKPPPGAGAKHGHHH